MVAFLKLIRYKNLLIIIATQYLTRYFVINPILSKYNFKLQFSEKNFALLSLSTALLAAAGYIINDYFDRKADLINRPKTVIVGTKIKRRAALLWHSVFNVIGVGIGFYLSIKIGMWYFGIIYLIITGILWYYSTFYKKRILIGNLVVASLTGLVPVMVLFFELPLLDETYGSFSSFDDVTYNLLIWTLGFSFFAFITTLIREIVKDIEDIEGDKENNRRSLPIAFGIPKTKAVVLVITGVTLLLILFSWFYYLDNLWFYKHSEYLIIYMVVLLIIPLLYFGFKLVKSNTKKDFHLLSSFMKLIMLCGLLFSVFSWFLMTT